MSEQPARTEEILEPDLPIIDPHHHLWDFRARRSAALQESAEQHPFDDIMRLKPRYLLDELLADTGSGHNVVGTVFVQCGAFYRADAPPELAVVGETEFVNGVAAMTASGAYGPIRACAGIVSHADMTLGDVAAKTLEAHVAAGNGRFRGIRHIGAHDPDGRVLGPLAHAPAGLYGSDAFRSGFKHLGKMGLSFDAWVLEPQIPEVTALARAFPQTPIVLDHVGTPIGLGSYAGKLEERFGIWREAIGDLAKEPNVFVKLGGLAMPFLGFPGIGPDQRTTSEALAQMWRPYIETCIEAFGAERAMFESNFPVDYWGASYADLWNAFKRIAGSASDKEKQDLFAGAAARFYKVEI